MEGRYQHPGPLRSPALLGTGQISLSLPVISHECYSPPLEAVLQGLVYGPVRVIPHSISRSKPSSGSLKKKTQHWCKSSAGCTPKIHEWCKLPTSIQRSPELQLRWGRTSDIPEALPDEQQVSTSIHVTSGCG